jgi:protein-S-isoprenylcysteine O-methyltransferase Ste14
VTHTTKTLSRIAIAGILGGILGVGLSNVHAIAGHDISGGLSLAIKMSIAIWVAFSVYWSVAAKDRAPTKSSESTLSRQLHLLAINGALLLLILPVPGLRQRFLPDTLVVHAGGLAVQIAFTLLAVWARRHLGSNWSGEVRIASSHQLVRSGPYAVVRHPIYTALVGMYIGTLIVSGELHTVVALVIMFAAYARKIGMEERALAERFAGQHDEYRRATWAWLPGIY